MKNNKYLLVGLLTLSIGFTSCNGNNSEAVDCDNFGKNNVNYSTEFYDNNSFNNFVNSGNSSIKGQLDGVGIGDPYILRYNGTYYLYAANSSLGDGKAGVMGWKSKDLVNWDQCQNDVLDKGYVSSKDDSSTTGAYGPEVVYNNGNFYMYESMFTPSAKGPSGHRILIADNPEGPFSEISVGAIDSYCDGTVVSDKYENSFFLTTGTSGINVGTMSSMSKIVDTKSTIASTNYAGDTSDSPSVFEYMGKYYLTYSGLHEGVGSYQVCYSVSNGWGNDDTPEGISTSFKKGANLPLIVNADKENGFTGLGSASTFLGPDLDSYYMAYQCMNQRKGRDRSLNIDRLYFGGSLLTSSYNRYSSVKAALPEISYERGNEFVTDGSFLLSSNSTKDIFSAEYNFRYGDGLKCVFSYIDSNNYSYAAVDLTLNELSLVKVVEGNFEIVATSKLYETFKNEALHTLRISYRENKFDLYFDNLPKMSAVDTEFIGGKIGYLNHENAEVNFTCASNVGRGLSNQKEVKQALCDIPAAAFMTEDQIDGVKSYKFSNDSGVKTIENDAEYTEVDSLNLKTKGDFARYLVNFKDSCNYSLDLVFNKKDCGKDLYIELDGEKNIKLTIPTLDFNPVEGSSNYMRVNLGDIGIEKGIRQFKLQNMSSDGVEIISFKFVKKETKDYKYSNSLSNELITGMVVADDSSWNFVSSTLHSNNDERNYAVASANDLHDFDMTVDFQLPTATLHSLTNESGVIFRAKNYAMHSDTSDGDYSDDEESTKNYAFQGYYLALTTMSVTLYRVNFYGLKTIELVKVTKQISANKFHNVIVVCRGNLINVKLDGTSIFSYCDDFPFTSGSAGLLATNGEIYYKNFKIQSSN